MSLNVPGMDFIKNQWSDMMVQHSVYAGVVFLICAHPEVFKFVDKNVTMLVKQVDKSFKLDGNLLLFIHACVVVVLMYVGTTYVFTPFSQMVQGFKNKGKVAPRKAAPRKAAPRKAAQKQVKNVGRVPVGASI